MHLFLLLRYTCNMCLLFSREGTLEGRVQRESRVNTSIHKASVSLWNESIQLKTIAGSLSSSLYENYSMGEFKGVWGSLSGTIDRGSHSLKPHKGSKQHKKRGRPEEISFAFC